MNQLKVLLKELLFYGRGLPSDLVISWLHIRFFKDETPKQYISESKKYPLTHPILTTQCHMPQSYKLVEDALKQGLIEKKIEPRIPSLLASDTEVLVITKKGEDYVYQSQ